LGALLTSTATGVLQIEARKDGGIAGNPGVFINAIRLVANPVIRITNTQLVNGNIRLTIETQYPGQPITIQETADVAAPSWSTATGTAERHGLIVIAEAPVGAGPLFYRVVSQ
jgi:hypothetical protein